jgi:NADPH2:quinone reductase
MAWGGRYLVVGFSSGDIPALALNLPLLKGCAIVGVAWDTYSRRHPEKYKANMSQLTNWIESGKLRPALTDQYPLSDASRALESILHRKIKGKAVVIP